MSYRTFCLYRHRNWSEKKQNEKIDYLHHNPVARGWVSHPGDGPWSSGRFYYREDRSILAMDRLP